MVNISLSVCMIVKNEEKFLDSCLLSIANMVDEIIVVDTGSSDGTIEIAKKHQAKTIEITWIDDFSYARNISLQNASMDWILVLDADEEVPFDELKKIKYLIQKSHVDAYQIIIRNVLPAGEIVSYNEQPALRLFKNKMGFEYRGKIHESVQASILESGSRIINSDIYINHYGYAHSFVQGGTARGERNLTLLLQTIDQNKFDPYIHYQIGITYKHLNLLESAETHLKNALSFNKNELSSQILSDIFLKLAQIASLNQQNKKCIKYAQNSIRQNPENLIAIYLLTVHLAEEGNYREAVPHLHKLLQSDIIPDDEKDDLKTLLDFCLTKL